MQKGFATLEIIFATLIIAILASTAIPNAARMIDRVALDYETKKLYTDLRLVQSFDRMAYMPDSHFNNFANESVNLIVNSNLYTIKKNSTNVVYAEHIFSRGVTIDKTKIINFDDMGKITPATSDTLTLSSGFGNQIYFKFDSVGRFRGDLNQ